LPFENFKKSVTKHFKTLLNDIKYGDDHRLPLLYVPTCSTQASMNFFFPNDSSFESFKNIEHFPKLREEILLDLFRKIGVLFVPEITRYYLKEKNPFEIFENFCLQFGANEEGEIEVDTLNTVIDYLQRMDSLRSEQPFNSKPIYSALAQKNFTKVENLIEKMKNEKENLND
jgi:hypothetical protein